MKKTNNNQFDDYLGQIEALERKERRKKGLYALAFLLLGGGMYGLLYLWTGSSNRQMMTYVYAELDTLRVGELLSDGASPFMIYHPELGRDTIHNTAEYLQFVSTVALLERDEADFGNDNEWEAMNPVALEEESGEQLPVYFLDIVGTRKTQEALSFTVEDYDPYTAYSLDLGNGEWIRMRQTASYMYSEPGTYRLRLYASRKGYRTSVYTKQFDITGSGTLPANGEILADNAAPLQTDSSTKVTPTVETMRGDAGEKSDSNQLYLASTSNPILPVASGSPERRVPQENRINPGRTDSQTGTPGPIQGGIDFRKPLFSADISPQYPGGRKAMNRFIARNARYPAEARDNQVEGQVFVRFVVQPDGSLTDAVVFRGLGSGCDEEAIRLVQSMPNWIPGEHQGRTAPVYEEIPISFQLIK